MIISSLVIKVWGGEAHLGLHGARSWPHPGLSTTPPIAARIAQALRDERGVQTRSSLTSTVMGAAVLQPLSLTTTARDVVT